MSSLMASGVELMLVGMGTVFVFLTLLVVATRSMSALVLRYFPPQVAMTAGSNAAASAPNTDEEIAAISIALAEHLNKRSGSGR